MITSLESVIQQGSYQNSKDLDDVIKRVKRKITLLKKAINSGQDMSEELHKAEIFRDEFINLRENL